MKIFIDSANLQDIEVGLKRGFASGITTNPSLLAKEPKSSFEAHIGKILDLINTYQPGIHLSVEVFSTNKDEILRQAQYFTKEFNYPEMSIKIPIGWTELETIKVLSQQGISVNCTACMDVTQSIMAAQAGAKYISIFWGRIRDGGQQEAHAAKRADLVGRGVLDEQDFDPAFIVKATRQLLDQAKLSSEIIVGSIRRIVDIRDAALAGAHIITVPPKFFPDMASHFQTDGIVNQFMTDFRQWLL